MKPTILKSLALVSILALAIGCGKDNSSGGVGSYTNLYTEGLPQHNVQELDKVTRWFNGTQEGTQLSPGLYSVQRFRINMGTPSSNQNCVEKKFLGIPYIWCSSSSSNPNGSQSGEPIGTPIVMELYQDGRVLNQKGNTELHNALNGTAGKLVEARSVGYNVTELIFVSTDGQRITSIIIDRNFHSGVNPVQKTIIHNGTMERIVTGAQRVY